MPSDAQPTYQPGWYADPLDRYDHRYHNGVRWMADVSNDGQRTTDPLGANAVPLSPPPPGWFALSGRVLQARHRAHVPALWSMICGFAAVTLAALPFLFVIGAGLGVAAIVLAVVAFGRLSRTPRPPGGPPRESNRGRAICGVVLGPVALGLCAIGITFTGVTLREFDEFERPGLYEVGIDSCTAADGTATARGTIRNLSDRSRRYIVRIEFSDADKLVDARSIEIPAVEPGASADWGGERYVGRAELSCDLGDVSGPYPFDLDPGT